MVPTSRIGLLPSNSAANEWWARAGAAINRPAAAISAADAVSLAFMPVRIGGTPLDVKRRLTRRSSGGVLSKGAICFDTGPGSSYDSSAEVLLMTTTRRRLLATATVILCVSALAISRPRAADSLPSQLSDQEFWKLSTDFSEPDGFFRSDNLLSNEVWLQRVIPELLSNIKTPSVYMGVGPEQNFTYITNLRPKMVFIVDIRRGNFDLQLTYKALFELSTDRADFVSRLFSRKRPEGLDRNSSAMDIFAAYKNVATSETLFKENLKAIDDLLLNKHHFALSDGDVQGVEYVYHAFYNFGPDKLNYSSTGGFGGRYQPSYADLMVATDAAGAARSYLASDENYQFMKTLETKNLLVPVVGNFAGPKAIRAVGDYVRTKGATVSAFYLSNVEQYLYQDRIWGNFCRNVATLPLETSSTFIRSVRGGGGGPGTGLNSELGNMQADVKDCGASGQ